METVKFRTVALRRFRGNSLDICHRNPGPSFNRPQQRTGEGSTEIETLEDRSGRMETPRLLGRPRRRAPSSTHDSPPSMASRIVLARKFMQTLDDHVYKELAKFADQRGVTIQGLIRAVIVPEWVNSQEDRRRTLTTPQTLLAGNEAEPRTRNSDLGIANLKHKPLLQR